MSRTTTQQTIDAARQPLTDEEQMVYNMTSRRWLPAEDLDPEVGAGDSILAIHFGIPRTEALLESLIDKGWLDKTRMDGRWVYQRTHSLDNG